MARFFRQIFALNIWSSMALGALLVSMFFLFNSSARQTLQLMFRPAEREVLSIAVMDILGNGQANRVVKVKTPDAIVIEVYGPLEDHGRKLIDTIRLPDKHDGYYHLLGQAVNLAIKDMDGDRLPEIVAPTFDADMNPHLNVFKFNKEIQRFEPYQGASQR